MQALFETSNAYLTNTTYIISSSALRACSDFGFWAAHGKFYFKVR